MKWRIVILSVVLILLASRGCSPRYRAYLSGIENEKKAMEYMRTKYGVECEMVSKWAGHWNVSAGRQSDVFIMREASPDGFPFRINIYEDGYISDGYPNSFMGNEISKRLYERLNSRYGDDIARIKCNSYVNTQEKTLFTSLEDIDALPERDIEVSIYLVSNASEEVQQEILCEAFDYLQSSFLISGFRLDLYFLKDEDFQTVKEHLDKNVHVIFSFELVGIQPLASFEYRKNSETELMERSEILAKFQTS